jgi:hypothetical protein
VRTKRDEVSYSLERRATLLSLFRGMSSNSEACDPNPYLKLAAKHHGELIDRPCPLCKKFNMVELRYVYGDQLGQYTGRIKTIPELTEMEKEFGEFTVYIVEICRDCGWNHLISSFKLGDGVVRKAPRKGKTYE